MAKVKKAGNIKQPAQKKSSWFSVMKEGRIISVDFFKNNAWLLIFMVVAIVALIGLRYKTKTKMEEITRLTTELEKAQSNQLQEKAQYMTLIRETEMRKMVHDQGLPLEFQEQPPYVIVDNGEDL